MGSDGQAVLNFAGSGTTKFSGGLFQGVNSYYGGTGTTIFLVGCFGVGGDGQNTKKNLQIMSRIKLGTGTTIFLVGLFADEW